jgi:4-hydroxybutyrate dehydrogenase
VRPLPAGARRAGTERLRDVIGVGSGHDLGTWVEELNARLGLPDGLAAMGVSADVLPPIAEHAEDDPATENNARPVSRADYKELLRASRRKLLRLVPRCGC